jgi:16S rRNA (uracil1498-N3)-methyltransferase
MSGKIHRFFVDQKLSLGKNTISDNATIDHMIVVRIEVAERIIFFNGDGFDYDGNVTKKGRMPEIEILEKRKNKNEPLFPIHLYLSILKRENTELALEKAIELGITDFTPVLSERTVKTSIKQERLEKIARSASEQSGRGIFPRINTQTSLEDALKEIPKNTTILFFDTVEHSNGKTNGGPTKKPQALFVGPEGGWTDGERDLARAYGATFVQLVPTVLRGETAAIIATYYALTHIPTGHLSKGD